MKLQKIHIDFETYSECDLKKQGAWNYSRHPSTTVLCTAISVDNCEPAIFYDKYELVCLLETLLPKPGVQFYAWNSFFECSIINNVLGITITDFTNWNDVMAWASASALPQSLEKCSKVLFPGEQDKQKGKEGKSLIAKLCMPQRISWLQLARAELWKQEHPNDAKILEHAIELKKQATKIKDATEKLSAVDNYTYLVKDYVDMLVHPRYKHDGYDDMLADLGTYCMQDTVVERMLSDFIRPLSDAEKQVWVQDQTINWRGIKCDVKFCTNATSIFENSKEEKLQEIKRETGLDNPNSTAQLSKWLKQYIEVDNLQSATIRELLLGKSIPNNVRDVLSLRSSSARTPPKKYASMLLRADSVDSRIRGTLVYHAASTGRWASRGINVQNLPRPTLKTFNGPVQLILNNSELLLELSHGDKIETLCGLLRCSLIPSDGNTLVVSDYSSIEARVLAWLAGEEGVLDVFRTHGKVYEYAASKIYKVAMDKIDKEQRFVGKTSVLACGYQGGKAAFQRMAENYGVEIPEEKAEAIVKEWRKTNPKIVKLWYATQKKAIAAMLNKGKIMKVNDYIAFKFVHFNTKPYLLCRLPSGRLLTYVDPKLKKGKYGNQLTYRGMDSLTRQWVRIDTYGGKLCIGKDTPVLTEQGWKPIQYITNKDILWDGENWCTCGGNIYKGNLFAQQYKGVVMTPDHKILTQSGWVSASQSEGHNRFYSRLPKNDELLWNRWEEIPMDGRVCLQKAYSLSCNRKSRVFGMSNKGSTKSRKQVYDILDCGSNNRFVVRDTNGVALIVHNCENITQAVARDILANAKLNVMGTDYDNVVLSVHDELICDVPKHIANAGDLSKLMCDIPEWAEGLPVSAEGEVTERYWK